MTTLHKDVKQPFYFYPHSNAFHFNFYFPVDYQPKKPELFDRMKTYTKLENRSRILRARAPGVALEVTWSAYSEQLGLVDSVLVTLFEFIDKWFGSNMIIVLYANHGAGSRMHNKFGVGLPYQEFVHVPVFIRRPKVK